MLWIRNKRKPNFGIGKVSNKIGECIPHLLAAAAAAAAASECEFCWQLEREVNWFYC